LCNQNHQSVDYISNSMYTSSRVSTTVVWRSSISMSSSDGVLDRTVLDRPLNYLSECVCAVCQPACQSRVSTARPHPPPGGARSAPLVCPPCPLSLAGAPHDPRGVWHASCAPRLAPPPPPPPPHLGARASSPILRSPASSVSPLIRLSLSLSLSLSPVAELALALYSLRRSAPRHP
jgi:hypothetical protein